MMSVLDVYDNQLVIVEARAVRDLNRLSRLGLHNNSLKILPSGVCFQSWGIFVM